MLAVLLFLVTMTMTTSAPNSAPPIGLHPANPHYFLFRGKPTILLTSGEHYGAVLNAEFSYLTYLDELRRHKLNYTRIFTGAYVEDSKSFNITHNTLAPTEGKFLCPWARSATPGYAGGGNKFDLNRWDEAYFRRLHDFVRQAGKRSIVVEISLFCPFYEDSMWAVSPLNPRNNVNNTPDAPRTEVYALKHPELTRLQDALVRKIAQELAAEDNVFYEICNEPYFGGVTREWQHHVADTLRDAEAKSPAPHLIAQNIANGKETIEKPHPAVSLFNFHYASPPDTVGMNYQLNKAIGFDETGFAGHSDLTYRSQAWEFLLAGGGLYNNLDYSFTVGHEKGDYAYPAKTPGGGGLALRKQLTVLHDFLQKLDFAAMRPDTATVRGVPKGGAVYALSAPGKEYAVYIRGGKQATLQMDIPAGRYRVEWIDTLTGETDTTEEKDHAGGMLTLESPVYEEDIALRLYRR